MKGSVKLPVFIDDARKLVNTTQLRAKYLGATYEAEYCQWQTLHGLGSLMETASLIITPNAYLEGKLLASYPPDPIGDFDVTRATTATRVNSAGLVELVPYNLLQYSSSFVTAPWQSNATITANAATAPDGTMTATRVQLSSGSAQYLYQGAPDIASGTATISCWIKGATAQTISFNDGNTIGNSINITTEWVRYEFTLNTNGVDLGLQFDNYFGVSPAQQAKDFYVWGAQLVEGSTAKDYQKTETRLNIPRLDYSNGTCPSLLVEPQRTNSLLNSNQFNGAAWGGLGIASFEYVSNPVTGMSDAMKITKVTGNTDPFFQQGLGAANGTWTYSMWLWTDSGQPTTAAFYMFNASVSEFFALPITLTNVPTRYTFTNTFANTGGLIIVRTVLSQADANQYIYAYGGQVEFGSYATSYIPTTSASVTRNADVISKTGISSLIGQTEGTLFFEVANIANDGGVKAISLSNGTIGNTVEFAYYGNNQYNFIVRSGTQQYSYASTLPDVTQMTKFAFAYKQNDFALYINGVQVNTSSSGNVPSSLDRFEFDWAGGAFDFFGTCKAAALWKTRKTNDELAQLTTI